MDNEEASLVIRRALFLTGRTEHEVVTSMEAFRDFAAQVLKLAIPEAVTLLVGSSSIRMTKPGTKAVRTITLTNHFGRLDSKVPKEGLTPFVAHLSSMVRMNPDAAERSIEDLLSDVVPLLKSSAYAQGNARVVRQASLNNGLDPDLHAKLSWEVNSQVVAFPVVNHEGGYEFITGDKLVPSGLTSKEIEAIAIQNVRSAYEALPPSDYSKGSREFSGLGGFASALVVVPEFLEKESAQAGGPLCLLSGDADHLYIVPLANEEFLDFVLGRVATGELRLPEIPPLVYQDGRLEAAMIQPVQSEPLFSI
ncbi:hypothetical protein [Rhizobium sp. MHM7A]|uniref:hypothetical protein n=1 Tax=Rhizobium sp. MHM7A TaxID=2583233 RepID=UPI0011063065|nr:hypothetical protein [Rhizobium sp. MHM7A]TLX15788.1 hypothetical protein FFR93_00280 [Rhizobium sp. MHM7A]